MTDERQSLLDCAHAFEHLRRKVRQVEALASLSKEALRGVCWPEEGADRPWIDRLMTLVECTAERAATARQEADEGRKVIDEALTRR